MIFVLSLAALLPLTQALSWSSVQKTVHKEAESVTPAEFAAILQASETLATYAKKPDCFRKAAGRIQLRCDELEVDEAERVKAALSMTLCEIATADHHTIPLECASFRTYDSHDHTDHPGECVSALSRSAQYWSSYSGYLRETSQLCYVFRRQFDIDTARELNRNATVASISVLSYMAEREDRLRDIWTESITVLEAIRSVLGHLHDSSVTINSASGAVADTLSVTLQEMIGAYRSAMDDIISDAANSQSKILDQIDGGLSQALDTLAITAASIAPHIERLFDHHLSAAHSSLVTHQDGLARLADQINSQFIQFGDTFQELQRATTTLVTDARRAGADLEVQLRLSAMAQEKQLETAKAADNVSAAFSQLVVMVREEIQELNGTFSEVKDTLWNAQRYEWTSVLWTWLQDASILVFKVRPAHFDTPYLRVVYACMRVLRVVLTFASSTLMSVLVVLASIRNLFAKSYRNEKNHSGSPSMSVEAEVPRARARVQASWTETWPLDLIRSDRARGKLAADLVSNQLLGPTSSRRSRPSRIPDRLCNMR